MFEGHVELSTDVSVAVVAKRRLHVGQQIFRCFGTVNRMAVGANHVVHRVFGAANLRPGEIFAVTIQAIVENLVRLQFGKSDDCGLAASGLDMFSAGSVATFASGTFRRLLSPRNLNEVRILKERHKDVRMTNAARVAADIAARSRSNRPWGALRSSCRRFGWLGLRGSEKRQSRRDQESHDGD